MDNSAVDTFIHITFVFKFCRKFDIIKFLNTRVHAYVTISLFQPRVIFPTSQCKQRGGKWPLAEKLSLLATCEAKDTDVVLANFPFRLIWDVLCLFFVETNLGQKVFYRLCSQNNLSLLRSTFSSYGDSETQECAPPQVRERCRESRKGPALR